MAGQGKYTKFAPEANDKNTLMAKLYKGAPTADLVGKENDARELAIKIAQKTLTHNPQQGDLGIFPHGVYLDYSGNAASIQPPNTTEGKDVVWIKAGDPANSYVPDISSPGAGKTDGRDKDVDPKIDVKTIKPNYVPGTPDTGTRAPTTTIPKIVAHDVLGLPQKKGDSGANT